MQYFSYIILYYKRIIEDNMKIQYKKILILIIFIKLLVLVLFTSEQSNNLFLPFVKSFIESGSHPWQYYFDHQLAVEAFPYHPLMLYILSIFTYPIVLFNIENIYIINFFFKLPLLLADIAIFYILLNLFKDHMLKVILFYFINPIIFYATYIHSQLDIIPTAFLLYGLYLLVNKRLNLSAITIGLALATKSHILLAIPLLFIYVYKNYTLKKAIFYFAIAISILIFFDLPYLSDKGFWEMVILNTKQSLLFDSYYNIGDLKIFLPLFSVMAILAHFFNQRKINRDLLFFYFGILFSAIIFFVVPSPAWYVWVTPFIAIYFIRNKNINTSLILYGFLSLFYLIFFMFFYSSEYTDIIFMGNNLDFKIHNAHWVNISFTLLEASVAAVLFMFYKYGVKSNSVYKKTTHTVIGIGGDSGVGKTSLLNDLVSLLGNRLLQLEGDGEHKWERGDENWNKFTHLDPKANHIHDQTDAIYELKHHNSIKRSNYDHDTGKFTVPVRVKPKEFISLSGLHPFYLAKMRKNIDLKIYIDTDEKLRRHWKILRDTKHRGYSKDKILEQIESRVEDTKKYIYPQKRFADLVIKYHSLNEFSAGEPESKINIGLKVVLDANIHLEKILESLSCEYVWDYNDDLVTQYIILEEEPQNDFSIDALTYVPNIHEILDVDYQFLEGYRGFVQLLVLLSLSEKMKGGVTYEI